MVRRPVLLTVCLMIGSWACDVLSPGEKYSGPLNFEIREGHFVNAPPPPPQIVLGAGTEAEYGCAGYRLDHEFSTSGNLLRVSVSDRVRRPQGPCAAVMTPAGFSQVLPITIGTYWLEFTRAGVTDRHSITVTDTTIEITPIEAHFTHPTALTFPRAN